MGKERRRSVPFLLHDSSLLNSAIAPEQRNKPAQPTEVVEMSGIVIRCEASVSAAMICNCVASRLHAATNRIEAR